MRSVQIPTCLALVAISAAPTAAATQTVKETPTSQSALAAEASVLIGKNLDDKEQSKIADRAPRARAGEWEFGLGYGEEGDLVREASSGETGKGKLMLKSENSFSTRF